MTQHVVPNWVFDVRMYIAIGDRRYLERAVSLCSDHKLRSTLEEVLKGDVATTSLESLLRRLARTGHTSERVTIQLLQARPLAEQVASGRLSEEIGRAHV